ncbi:efflux RND transporter periplasmic adaptor subunit [Chitinophaga sp. G-6-1-13]|uniref:Efflux RND transporter periplasmic adaptor subunit n=1 Tax=Chitinophaga fulva TaxID=2728842 RepID=A0A848GF91_9BACT|nr:efflux RND transporter periplasmic adaptor subunit [Chitinophaga fulva]
MFCNKINSLVFLLFPVIVLNSCGSKLQHQTETSALKEFPVLTVEVKNTSLYSDYPASIQGVQNIEIRPKVDGFIEKIYVDEGASVQKGQVLFKINAPQYEQEMRTAAAAIKSAEAEVGTARMQVEKVIPLVKEEIVSSYELETAKFILQTKEAALVQAKASLVNAHINIGYTTILSPVDGVIGGIPYKTGSLVTGSSLLPLTTVSAIKEVYAYFSVNEKQFLLFSETHAGITLEDKLQKLAPVSLILPTGVKYKEKGRVTTVNGLINTETGAVSFRATFPNALGIIRSGGSAIVRMQQEIPNALLVPQKATYEMQGKRFVYKLDEKNTANSTAIEVVEGVPGDFFVVQNGLKAGDRIVASGIANLKDGIKIKATTTSLQ